MKLSVIVAARKRYAFICSECDEVMSSDADFSDLPHADCFRSGEWRLVRDRNAENQPTMKS